MEKAAVLGLRFDLAYILGPTYSLGERQRERERETERERLKAYLFSASNPNICKYFEAYPSTNPYGFDI